MINKVNRPLTEHHYDFRDSTSINGLVFQLMASQYNVLMKRQ